MSIRSLPHRRQLAVTVLLVLLLPVVGLAAGFSPETVAKVSTVTSAAISPDGSQVAYGKAVPRIPFEEDDGSSWRELHVVGLDGESRPFITGEVSVGRIDWSPDGKLISWVGKRGDDENAGIYAIPVAGGESMKLVTHPDGIGEYSWSPDGKKIAFIAKEKKDEEVERLKKKGFKAEIYEEQWRPRKVWIAELTGDSKEPAEGTALELEGSAKELHWSPKGDQLVVTLAPTSLIDDEYMNRQIHFVDAGSGKVAATIKTPGKLGMIRWSPDGKRIAFIGAAGRNDPMQGRLFVVSASGGTPKNLLPAFDDEGHVEAIAWQDADTIMYIASRGVWTEFAEIDRNGKKAKQLIASGGPILRSFDLAADGQSATFVADSPAHPQEVFAMRHGEKGPRRLTDSNPWLADMDLAVQEPIRYSARDGLELDAILYRPLDEKKGERYPLIVVAHGGPESHFSNGWLTGYSRPGQMGAAAGYAVVYPNYRASTGRGVEFSKMDQADYAGPEFDDLVDAAEHLIKVGLVERGKVGITGGSYGGFASAWAATALTEHFQASVMFVGISDHISKAGTTDIPTEMYEVHSRRWPWDYWDWFRERSPLYHVQKSKTPTLILHGKEDTRVHPSQSMELYRYMKLNGKTVRLVLYPGEGHGNRKAAARLDYSLRLMRWMDHYLMGEGGDPPAHELEYPFDEKKDEEEEGAEADGE